MVNTIFVIRAAILAGGLLLWIGGMIAAAAGIIPWLGYFVATLVPVATGLVEQQVVLRSEERNVVQAPENTGI